MLTLYRLAPVRFTSFATLLCFLALGCFDTVQAQTLTVSSSSLAFTAAQGANPVPNTQTVNVGSTGGNLTYNISFAPSGSWLAAQANTGFGGSSSGNTPSQLGVVVTSSALAIGSYSGTVTLTPNVGTPVTISVSLTVSGTGINTSALSASPSQLSFGYQLNQVGPPSQSTQITSSGIALPLSFSTNTAPTANCPGGWFQASLSSNATPATLTVSIVTAGLTPGTCTGNVTLSSNTPSNGTATTLVGVTLFISSSALLNVSIPPGMQSLTLQQGGRPVQFGPTSGNPLILSSSDPNQQLTYTLAVNSTNGWLAVSPKFGTTPANIDVQITPGTILSPGSYNGSIQITSSGLFNGTNNTLTIPIALTITSQSSVSISPTGAQNLTELQGGPLPTPISLTLTGAPAQSPTFTTSVIQGTGGSWLIVSPSAGALTATPTTSTATVTLSAAANNLAQGTYSAQAVITFSNSAIAQIIVPVSLTVGAPASAVVATPPAVSFSYQAGGPTPSPQTISISNPAAGSIPYTVASVSDNWFSVAPPSGNTPGSLTISVSPQSLQPGSYSGSFTLTSSGVATTTVPVALFISASTTPQPFIISNAASGVGGQLSPGEIITIKGSGLGPGIPVSFTLNSLLNPILSGVQVTFNGISGTLLYVSSTQINVTVPYAISGSASAAIVVNYQGLQSSPITQPVGQTALGLFTDDSTGSGQVAAVNQNFTYNTPASPATQGSVISVYGTGGGQTSPASTDGQVSPTSSLLPLLFQQSITATIGGKAATITFAGAAPGDVTGVVQFNIQVPSGVSGTALPIVILRNGSPSLSSQANATVAVQ
jgi:uncharacterized protein (TIGR03437 family)